MKLTRQLFPLPKVDVRRPWTAKEQSLLGTAPDQELAALLNRNVASVQSCRRELGMVLVELTFQIRGYHPIDEQRGSLSLQLLFI